MKLSEHIQEQLDIIREELPDDEYLHIFNVANKEQVNEINAILVHLKHGIEKLKNIQDELYSV